MKKVLFSLFISSVLFMVGCQENSVTNPVSPESVNKAASIQGTTVRGTFVLDQKMANPIIKANPGFVVIGKINYIENIFPQNTITGLINTAAPQADVKLDLSIDASVKSVSSTQVGQDEWKVFSESKDQVIIKDNGNTVLIKSFPLIGRNDTDMTLVCTFTVTEKGLRLDSVVLNTPRM